MFEFVSQHAFGAALLLAALTILASGCAARYTVHPGALNKTDSAAYDALLVAETCLKLDPYNQQVQGIVTSLRSMTR